MRERRSWSGLSEVLESSKHWMLVEDMCLYKGE